MSITVRRYLSYGLLLLSASVALSCGSGSGSKPHPKAPDVYVAGFEVNDSDTEVAKYWKNGARVTLGAGTFGSLAYSVFVSGNDVYVAGTEGSPDGDIAKYWKNGVEVPLSAGAGNMAAVAFSIFVDGNDVYASGVERGVAKYWKNGVAVDLTDGTQYGEARSIVVSSGDVYVGGWQYKTTQIDPTHSYTTPVAKYWKNGVPVELSDPLAFGVAESIFISGSDIYVAGNTCQENEPPGCDLVTYWKNGTPVVLPGQKPTAGTSIFVSGTDVYVTGDYLVGGGANIAELWKNGTLTALAGTTDSAANAVVVSGNDVYVAGASINNIGSQVAGYWKNRTFTAITDGTHFASGFAMTVVQH